MGGRVEVLFTESFSTLEIGLDVTFCSHHPFFGSMTGFWMEEVGFLIMLRELMSILWTRCHLP
jgi:hypothetical protein